MDGVTRPGLPDWVSAEVIRYLEHMVAQVSIRELARRAECHPSTVLRQIRRLEQRREDPLIDGVLHRLSLAYQDSLQDGSQVSESIEVSQGEIFRCLTVLAQTSAVLVAGREMEKAIIVRDIGKAVQNSVVERRLVEVLALQDMISCFSSGQVHRYRITRDGRNALAAYVAQGEARRRAREESLTQSGISEKMISLAVEDSQKRCRYGLQDTPLQTLARLVDRDGVPFLTPEMVRAGKRLREDFELA